MKRKWEKRKVVSKGSFWNPTVASANTVFTIKDEKTGKLNMSSLSYGTC